MIRFSVATETILASPGFQRWARIECWYGDQLVADDVPLIAATEYQDSSLRVPERLTFTVPAKKDGYSWVPNADIKHPLQPYGQRVKVSLGVSTGGDEIEWINRGWFLLYSAESNDEDTVDVEALGLLMLVDEAELPSEFQPKTGMTLGGALRALIEPGLGVNLDSAPTDRPALTTITYSDNRLDSVQAILDAWPAEMRVTQDGYVAVTPTWTLATVDPLVLSDRKGGNMLRARTSVTRDGTFNAVVAKGQYPDTDATRAGQEIIQTARDTQVGSPFATGTEYSPYLVPYGYASPLMTTAAMVLKAAQTTLTRLRRKASQTVVAVCVPHPGVQLGDVVTVTSDELGLYARPGVIDAFELPYLADGGPMTLTIRLGVF